MSNATNTPCRCLPYPTVDRPATGKGGVRLTLTFELHTREDFCQVIKATQRCQCIPNLSSSVSIVWLRHAAPGPVAAIADCPEARFDHVAGTRVHRLLQRPVTDIIIGTGQTVGSQRVDIDGTTPSWIKILIRALPGIQWQKNASTPSRKSPAASNSAAQIATAQQAIRALEAALNLYRLDNSEYPTTEQGMNALVQRPTSPQPPHWKKGGYIDRLTQIHLTGTSI